MDLGDPDAPYRPQSLSATRKTWLVLRVYAALLLGFGTVLVCYTRHNLLGCLLGCLVMLVGLVLSFSKGSGFRHRFSPEES